MTAGASWRLERRGAVARFLLDSPDGRQVLSPAILADLARKARGETSSGARVIAVGSARPNIFAAGADLSVIRALSPSRAFVYAREGQEAIAALSLLPAAVVAEVDGPCFGGACDLVMGCDVRVATDRSTFSHPGPRIGMVTGWGGTVLAPRLLGRGNARRLFADGRVFDASSALDLGLVDEVVLVSRWAERCLALEAELASDGQFPSIKTAWAGGPGSER